MAKGRPPTMKQVAALAGVDVSVVSRLLNDDPRLSVSEQTKERILDAVKQLGYRRNLAASSLRTARGLLVAFLLPEFTNPVYSRIAAGAQRRAVSLGYEVLLGDLEGASQDHIRGYRARGVDGILVAAGNLADEFIAGLAGDLPVVAVNREIPGSRRWAVVDYRSGSRLAADHLNRLGHTKIGVLTGPGDQFDTGRQRVTAFTDALDEGARAVALVQADGLGPEAGRRAGAELLARHPEVTAVFATTLMLAVGLLRAAREAGLRVPDDLSVISLHDVELAGFMEPPLTTVAMPMVELGAAAFDQLLAVIDGEDPEPTVVAEPPVLNVRSSTAPPRAPRQRKGETGG